jgi:predicted RNA-binding Zn-ribbon protein involved in translation (DUF1610 family)
MTIACYYCGKKIDTGHDAHYCCTCSGEYTVVCKKCRKKDPKCPKCGKSLKHKGDSVTKKAFYSPSTRRNLGF